MACLRGRQKFLDKIVVFQHLPVACRTELGMTKHGGPKVRPQQTRFLLRGHMDSGLGRVSFAPWRDLASEGTKDQRSNRIGRITSMAQKTDLLARIDWRVDARRRPT